MKTIEMELNVVPNGKSVMEILFPPDVIPGKHKAILIIEDEPLAKEKENVVFDLNQVFSKYNVSLLNPLDTFRRENIYDDDGR